MSSLQQMLPESLPEVIEEAFLEKLRSKMLARAAMLVPAVRAIRETYGEEGVETIHRTFRERAAQLGREQRGRWTITHCGLSASPLRRDVPAPMSGSKLKTQRLGRLIGSLDVCGQMCLENWGLRIVGIGFVKEMDRWLQPSIPR